MGSSMSDVSTNQREYSEYAFSGRVRRPFEDDMVAGEEGGYSDGGSSRRDHNTLGEILRIMDSVVVRNVPCKTIVVSLRSQTSKQHTLMAHPRPRSNFRARSGTRASTTPPGSANMDAQKSDEADDKKDKEPQKDRQYPYNTDRIWRRLSHSLVRR